ncbi:hypothetical protein Q3G72_019871 [Acer saccharum]|nr:hypothetical protein Q3G72_019871 [Acer saccharum]
MDGQVGELHVGHVGDLHSLEPYKNLLRTDAAINTLGKQFQAVKEDIQPVKTSQANELGQSGVTAQVNMDLPINKFPDPNILASSSSSIPPISKTVKWKRAARSKGGLSDLGEINSLGKRRSLVLEDVVQFTSKRAKDGLSECGDAVRLAEGNFSLDNIDNAMGGFVTVAVEGVDTAAFPNLEAIRQVVTQPESVTSHEVLSLVSDSL